MGEGLEGLAKMMKEANRSERSLVSAGKIQARAAGLSIEQVEFMVSYAARCPRCGGYFRSASSKAEAFKNLLMHMGWGTANCEKIKRELASRKAVA